MMQDFPLRMIPVWLRVLAGILTAAAALAIVLTIRSVPGQVIDLSGFLRLAAQAVLYFCVAVLFGYVAVTGLPPTHLWRFAGHAWWPAQPQLSLTPDVQRFVARLKSRHPQIRECWVLEPPSPAESWFMVLAEPAVHDAVRADWDIRRKDVRLYLLDVAAQTVSPAWGRAVPAGFAAWDWEVQSDALAEFRCPVTGGTRIAQRLWGS